MVIYEAMHHARWAYSGILLTLRIASTEIYRIHDARSFHWRRSRALNYADVKN